MRLIIGVRPVTAALALGLMGMPTPAVGQQSAKVDVSEDEAIERAQLQLAFALNASSPPPLQAGQARRRRPRSASRSNVGYVDNAIVGTQIQIRYDNATGNNGPDRAEFVYGKCGCYRELGADPDAPGPSRSIPSGAEFTTQIIETDLDLQDIVLDAEVAFNDKFSVFVEVPFRVIRGAVLMDAEGIGDVSAGFKLALVANEERYLTFQMRTYLPTGQALDGLGTDHLSFEPGLLYHEGSGDRFKFEAEARLWIPLDGSNGLGTEPDPDTDFDGDTDYSSPVIRFGLGLGYDLTPDSPVRFTPVIELVGWRVMSGIVTTSTDGKLGTWRAEEGEAAIVNLKVGARFGIRESDAIFIGYGKALTDDHWYDNIIRIEYRFVL